MAVIDYRQGGWHTGTMTDNHQHNADAGRYGIAEKLNPELWKKIKLKILWSDKYGEPGQWNARKAQAASRLYRESGGKYSTAIPQGATSLHRWTREKWDYISPGSKRYLPESVRNALTDAERQMETQAKTELGERAPYSDSVLEKMQKRV